MMWPFKRVRWEVKGKPMSNAAAYAIIRVKLEPSAIFLKDCNFRALPIADFEKIIFDCWFPRDFSKYKPEIWDCDNYAVAFMAQVQERWAKISRGKEALLFGYISANFKGTGQHAFIWLIDDSGELHYYEPQTGREFKPEMISVRLMES